MNYYLEVLKKYVDFEGRARRKEYWYFVLFNFIVSSLLTILDILIGTYNIQTHYGVISSIYSLAVFLPSIAVSVRRLHDTDRSGWWLILPIGIMTAGALLFVIMSQGSYNMDEQSTATTVVGGFFALAMLGSFITLFIFMVLDGTPGPNRFGNDPKEEEKVSSDHQVPTQDDFKKTEQLGQIATVTLRGEGVTASVELHPNRKIIIGRSSSANVCINNQYISGKHLAVLLNDNGTVTVTDLGSSNGTYLQGRKLESHIPYVLYPGERIVLGSEDIAYRL